MKLLLTLALLFTAQLANAQQTIIESLKTQRAGEGRVTIHQDAQISSLIGKRYIRATTPESQRTLKSRGFRVQVYAGNNSRQARNDANAVAEKVKKEFPDMPVYTYFQPPRWLCRVGDFKSIEEAHVAMRQLKASGTFKEVSIVREQINIPLTYITQHPRIENFAPATLPNTDKISVPLGRAGIYFNNDWLSLTSLFSYISKTNNNSTLNLQHTVNGVNEILAAPLNYDIKTLGWTTDVVTTPFKGFDLHFLFTYQKPTYKKYETSVKFSDGYIGQINATGNIVAEIPQVIIEIDPSYMITDNLKVWTSFRYFSKTYANINDAYYFNGRWETFGGVNWQVNKKLTLGCTIVNFLNQTGAKGSIAGAELVTKEEAGQYANTVMAGSYIRPFTVEFSAQIKF